MLAAVLSRHARPRGILFDRPHVVTDAPALLTAKGVSDRVTIVSGDFFQSVSGLQELIELRPFRFDHTDATADRAGHTGECAPAQF